MPNDKSKQEFFAGLEKMGMSVRDFARITGADERNTRRMLAPDGQGPSALHMFALRTLARNHIPIRPAGEAVDDRDARAAINDLIAQIVRHCLRAGWPPELAWDAMRAFADRQERKAGLARSGDE